MEPATSNRRPVARADGQRPPSKASCVKPPAAWRNGCQPVQHTMPVEFLSDEQAAGYGRYPADPSPEQLARFFYLSTQNIQFLVDHRRSYTRLGCAVQLGTLRFLGTFLPVPIQVPAVVVQTLAQQLHLTASTSVGANPAVSY